MKKVLTVILVGVLGLSMLAGCQGKKDPNSTTITIESSEYGDIGFSYVDDGTLKVTVADENTKSLAVLGDTVFDETLSFPGTVQLQKACIEGDGFVMVIGYTDYLSDRYNGYKTYDMYKDSSFWHDPVDVTYGGLKGYQLLDGICFLTFPSITQYAVRIIAIYPESVQSSEKVEDRSLELLELPAVRDILESLTFTGSHVDEPRFETMPVEDDFFSLTPVDGWQVSFSSNGFNSYTLYKAGVGNGSFGSRDAILHVEKWSLNSVRKEVDSILTSSTFSDAVQLDNIVINDREYLVVQDSGWSYIWLFTSLGTEPLDENAAGYIEIKLSYVDDLAPAMPVLQTITVK